jgi:hypothetical protein
MGLLSGHINSQAKPFWKIARHFTTPLFDYGVQVFNSADKADLLA